MDRSASRFPGMSFFSSYVALKLFKTLFGAAVVGKARPDPRPFKGFFRKVLQIRKIAPAHLIITRAFLIPLSVKSPLETDSVIRIDI